MGKAGFVDPSDIIQYGDIGFVCPLPPALSAFLYFVTLPPHHPLIETRRCSRDSM